MHHNPAELPAFRVRQMVVVLPFIVILASLPQPLAAGDPPEVACSSEKPIAVAGEVISLQAWTTAAREPRARYLWEATAGRVSGQGPTARWDLTGLARGRHAASVRVSVGSVVSDECLMRVVVYLRMRGEGHEGGWALLVGGHHEATGYGLYSYLLLGSPPSEAARPRYLSALEAYWRLMPEVGLLERYVPRAQLNVAYLPVTRKSGPPASPEWLLANYDYARARSLLRHLPVDTRDGPYLVSTLTPLSAWRDPAPGRPYLFQDLSAVPPHLAASWVKEFLNQAASERWGDERTGASLAKRLRLTVAILAEGLPAVARALDAWIAWSR